MDETDDNLVKRVKAHDVAALAQFISQSRKPLLAFIERQLGPGLRRRLEVDDIFQEVSVEAVRAWKRRNSSIANRFPGSARSPSGESSTLTAGFLGLKSATSAARCLWAVQAETRNMQPSLIFWPIR